MSAVKSKAIADGYKGWVVASIVVLLGSLTLFTGAVVAWFVYFMQTSTPLWVTVLAVVSVLGIGLGFGGLFLVMIMGAWKSRRKGESAEGESR